MVPRAANPGPAEGQAAPPKADRSWGRLLWYRLARAVCGTFFALYGGWRVSGREDVPESGGALLVANHASFLDVFLLGMSMRRPLNYVARSTLFVPVIGFLMRSIGGFPIQREGMGASGMKETLRRIRNGGIVTLFPEGTRTPDGELGPLKPGIAVLVARAGVPVIPAGIAGTFEAWPRTRRFPRPRPLRIHYGRPIVPEEIAGMPPEAVTALIAGRIRECISHARNGLARDLSP